MTSKKRKQQSVISWPKKKPNIGHIAAAANIIATAVQTAKNFREIATQTKTKEKSVGTRSLEHHQKVRFRHKKVRTIIRRPKGVSRRFYRNVTKVVNHQKNYGVYSYIGTRQLRQEQVDLWKVVDSDANGRAYLMDDPTTIMDAASTLWNAKSVNPDWTIASGNLSFATPIQVQKANISFYFKSSSSHVVNIEVYECTAKKDTDVAPTAKCNDTAGNFYTTYHQSFGALTPQVVEDLGWRSDMSVALLNFYRVKKHIVKLLPGASSSLTFKGKSRTYQFAAHDDDTLTGSIDPRNIIRGTKVFFFRIINDATVSGGELNPGYIHHFPSNSQGGVAMTYKRTYKITPIVGVGNSTSAQQTTNKHIIVDCHSGTIGDDQQVLYQNPVVKASVD